MQRVRWLTAAALGAVIMGSAAARAETDWKFYGGISSQNGESWCFYDANAVVRAPAGHVQTGHVTVPVRCLPRSDMDGLDAGSAVAGEIDRGVARLRRAHYVPPYATAETMERGQDGDITRLEQIANLAGIAPRVRISWELDCGKSQARELSQYVRVNRDVRSVDKPAAWKPIPPEANTVRLFRILCGRAPA